jgi:exodeoxyribonuclease VII large subunit
LQSLVQRRVFQSPLERIHDHERRVDDWDERLHKTMRSKLHLTRARLEALAGQLESLSPLNVLARGYSLTRTLPGKKVIRSIEQVKVGDAVEVVLADGRLQAMVQSKKAVSEE